MRAVPFCLRPLACFVVLYYRLALATHWLITLSYARILEQEAARNKKKGASTTRPPASRAGSSEPPPPSKALSVADVQQYGGVPPEEVVSWRDVDVWKRVLAEWRAAFAVFWAAHCVGCCSLAPAEEGGTRCGRVRTETKKCCRASCALLGNGCWRLVTALRDWLGDNVLRRCEHARARGGSAQAASR